jgi:hypothetical protein
MGRKGEVALGIDSVESADDIFVKVFDDEIAEKWKAEALSTEGRDVTQKMSDWVIDELRYKAKIFKETGTVRLFSNPPIPCPFTDCGTFNFVPCPMCRDLPPVTVSCSQNANSSLSR